MSDIFAPIRYDKETAAEALGISVKHLNRQMALRKITYIKDGRRVFFLREHLEAYNAKKMRVVEAIL